MPTTTTHHGQQLQEQWTRRLQIEHEYRHALSELYGPTDTDFEPTKEAEHLVNALISKAEATMGPEGTRLSIERNPVHRRFLPNAQVLGTRYQGNWSIESASQLDLVGAWDWLETSYGGQAGANEAYRQAADKIISGFWMRRAEGVKRTGGAIVLTANVWMETWSTGKQLSYQSADRIRDLCTGLKGFAQWAGRGDLRFKIDEFSERFCTHPREVSSRERITISGDLLVITYYKNFEFRFAGELGKQLQMFIGRFGDLEQAA